MADTIKCRLAYLVTPKPELRQLLGIDEHVEHEIFKPQAVITPAREYEGAFEGWKRQWLVKAKQEFIFSFMSTWSDEFPDFTAQLQSEDAFARWWDISLIDVVEIDPAWNPA